MIFKEIDNMKDVGAICHYFDRAQRFIITAQDRDGSDLSATFKAKSE
jgi:hypothetical protein